MTKKKVKQKRKYQWLYSGVAVAGVIIVCLVFSLSVFLPRESGDVYYSEADVYSDEISETELNSLFTVLPMMQECEYLTAKGVRLKENEKLVFLSVYGELISELDYYLITVNQHIDLRYNFVEKGFYSEFSNVFEDDEILSNYKFDGITPDGFNRFLMYLEKDNKIFYLEINCLGDNLDEFFVLLSE